MQTYNACCLFCAPLISILKFSCVTDYYFFPQLAQLLVCDWLLETRTTVWELDSDSEKSSDGTTMPVSQSELSGFQQDLASLRRLSQLLPVRTRILSSSHHVLTRGLFQSALPRLFLHEAAARLMAGAAPGRTQQLLDRSLRQRYNRSSVICGKGAYISSDFLFDLRTFGFAIFQTSLKVEVAESASTPMLCTLRAGICRLPFCRRPGNALECWQKLLRHWRRSATKRSCWNATS